MARKQNRAKCSVVLRQRKNSISAMDCRGTTTTGGGAEGGGDRDRDQDRELAASGEGMRKTGKRELESSSMAIANEKQEQSKGSCCCHSGNAINGFCIRLNKRYHSLPYLHATCVKESIKHNTS